MTTILSSSPSLSSLKLFRLSSRESLIDGAFLGNRTKPSQSLHLRFPMEAVSSISTSLSCISVGEDFPTEYEPAFCSTRRRFAVLMALVISEKKRSVSWTGFILLVAPFGRFFLWFLQTKDSDADCVNYQTANKLKSPLITKAAKRLIGGNGELKSKLLDFFANNCLLFIIVRSIKASLF